MPFYVVKITWHVPDKRVIEADNPTRANAEGARMIKRGEWDMPLDAFPSYSPEGVEEFLNAQDY